MTRRAGRTTKQMVEAPRDAVFVFPVAGTQGYYASLAAHLGRLDLKLHGPGFMCRQVGRYRAHDPATIVVDHATWDHIPHADEAIYRGWVAAHDRRPG